MPDDKVERGTRYQLGWLILDYLKVFTWPIVALSVVMFGWGDIMKLLGEREVNLFGVSLGQRVAGVQQRAEGELQDIAFLVGELESRLASIESEAAPSGATSTAEPRELARQIETKIGSLRENLTREVEQVQMSAPPVQRMPPIPAVTPRPSASETRLAQVSKLERAGYEALLARDLEAALSAFTNARQTWSDYHNVAELQRLLAQMRENPPRDATAWEDIYKLILTKYAWGMPDDIREQMRRETGSRGYSIGVRG